MEAGNHQTAGDPAAESARDSVVISLFPSAVAPNSRSFQVGDFKLVCDEDGANWTLGDEIVDTHMAIARVIGGISLGKPIPSVGGPSSQIQVGRMRPIHNRLLRSIPLREWVNFGAGVWCSHDGDRLSIALAPTETSADLP